MLLRNKLAEYGMFFLTKEVGANWWQNGRTLWSSLLRINIFRFFSDLPSEYWRGGENIKDHSGDNKNEHTPWLVQVYIHYLYPCSSYYQFCRPIGRPPIGLSTNRYSTLISDFWQYFNSSSYFLFAFFLYSMSKSLKSRHLEQNQNLQITEV